MIINEGFQVTTFIEKLPSLWRNFKNYLKYKQKEMTLKNIFVHLWIEEDKKLVENISIVKLSMVGANNDETSPKKKKKRSLM